MKHPRTTICGLIAGVGTLISTFFPEYSKVGGFIAALGIMAGQVFAADAKCTDPDCPKNPDNIGKTAGKVLLFAALIAAVFGLRAMAAHGQVASIRSADFIPISPANCQATNCDTNACAVFMLTVVTTPTPCWVERSTNGVNWEQASGVAVSSTNARTWYWGEYVYPGRPVALYRLAGETNGFHN